MKRRQKFTKDQIKRLANIFDNLGQVSVATLVLPYLLGIDKPDWRVVVFGLVITVGSWWLSLRLERMSS